MKYPAKKITIPITIDKMMPSIVKYWSKSAPKTTTPIGIKINPIIK